MYLASCGDAVTLHQLPTHSVKHVYKRKNAANSNVKSVSWNKDGSGVASLYSPKGFVEIICWKEDGTTVSQTAKVLQATSVCFLKTKASYVAIGTKTGDVVIWNCNTYVELQTFKAHDSPINLIDFNANDSFYATATAVNFITVFQYNSNQMLSTYKFPGFRVCTTIRFHPSKEAILGATSSNGSVSVWDVMLDKNTFTACKCHSSTCTDFVFSKVNNNFMTSIGYDRILLGHDLLQKKPAFKIKMALPLTCLDMTSDGNTVALGTTLGIVHVYDLRAGSSPLHAVNTYVNKVNRVAYSPEKASCSSLELPVIPENALSNMSDILNSTSNLSELSIDSFFKYFDPNWGSSSDLEELSTGLPSLTHTTGTNESFVAFGIGHEQSKNVSNSFILPTMNPLHGSDIVYGTPGTSKVVQESRLNNNVVNVFDNSTPSILNTHLEQKAPVAIEKDMVPLNILFTRKVKVDDDNSVSIMPMGDSNSAIISNAFSKDNLCIKTSTPTTQLARPHEMESTSRLHEDSVESPACNMDESLNFNNISPIAYGEKPSTGKRSVGTVTNTISYEEIQRLISRETYKVCGSVLWQYIGLKNDTIDALSSMQKMVETLTHKVEDLTQEVAYLRDLQND